METNAAFVGTNGIVKLNTISDVYMNFALVVSPRHAECDDSVGFN